MDIAACGNLLFLHEIEGRVYFPHYHFNGYRLDCRHFYVKDLNPAITAAAAGGHFILYFSNPELLH
jgi:hypothetical protein